MSAEKEDPRGPKRMTPKDFETTARSLEAYAKAFADIAEYMKQNNVDAITVTGSASMKFYLLRADAHYRSCREQLGYLAIGEMVPEYSYEEPKQEPKKKRTRRS